MPEKLFVHVDFGDGTTLLAGQLIVDDKIGRFKYAKAYINHPRAFALDPINLPLNADIHVKHRTLGRRSGRIALHSESRRPSAAAA